jgi:membrane protein YqaA with SNARE-associated domain
MFEAAQTVAHSVRHWIYHLGAIGFIPLGLLDSSIVPVPGSMDVLTIVLAARSEHWYWWLYYAAMATAGSVLGAYFTYRLGKKGGEKALEQKISARRLKKVRRSFERWGFASVAIPAVLPPPIPVVPFVLVAGAMKYPESKFLSALAAGRMVRYTILAILGGLYGHAMIQFLSAHTWVVVWVTLALAIIALLAYFIYRQKTIAAKIPGKVAG